MTTISPTLLHSLRELKTSRSSLKVLTLRRRNQLRSSFREAICTLFGWEEHSTRDVLDELLINGVSKQGEFSKFRRETFREDGDESTSSGLSEEVMQELHEKVDNIPKPRVQKRLKRKIAEIYTDIEHEHPTIHSQILKKQLCEEIRHRGLIATIRPDYITKYINQTRDNEANAESEDEEQEEDETDEVEEETGEDEEDSGDEGNHHWFRTRMVNSLICEADGLRICVELSLPLNNRKQNSLLNKTYEVKDTIYFEIAYLLLMYIYCSKQKIESPYFVNNNNNLDT